MYQCQVAGREVFLVCQVCGNDDFKPLDQAKTFFQCRRCTLGIQACPPENPGEIYTRLAYDQLRQQKERYHPAWARFNHDFTVAKSRLSALGKVQVLPRNTDSYITDFGAGNGAFLAAIRREGYKVRGVELDPNFCQEVTSLLGIRYLPTDTFLSQSHSYPCSMATLWDVLEHLIDGVGVLQAIAKPIDPKGFLVLELPDLSQLDGPIESWRHFKPDEHLTAWTPLALQTLLELHFDGFEKVHEEVPIPGKYQVVWRRAS